MWIEARMKRGLKVGYQKGQTVYVQSAPRTLSDGSQRWIVFNGNCQESNPVLDTERAKVFVETVRVGGKLKVAADQTRIEAEYTKLLSS